MLVCLLQIPDAVLVVASSYSQFLYYLKNFYLPYTVVQTVFELWVLAICLNKLERRISQMIIAGNIAGSIAGTIAGSIAG